MTNTELRIEPIDEEVEKTADQQTGVGTDLFIRKLQPGSTIGRGYVIEVYENGVKIDTLKAKNKKHVHDVIADFKLKYNTERSFLNESQVHVTYKTKQERGETAMETLDTMLLKKAATIGNMLQRLIDPTVPLKTRTAETAVSTGAVDFLPQTKDPNAPGTGEINMDEKGIAKEISKKIVDYFNEKAPAGSKSKSSPESPTSLRTPAPQNPSSNPEPLGHPQTITPTAQQPILASKEQGVVKTAEEMGGWAEKDELYNDVKKW